MLVINTIRGMPLLMVIFWMYFLLPALFGKAIPETRTVIMALTFFTSAYMSQIVRAGIEGIPKGQMEAAISTGLKHWQAMVYIILPQGLRNMIPSFVNQFVSLIKDTSLAFIVGVSELTHVATQINNRTMAFPTEIFFFIAVVYFIICYAFTSLSRTLEKRLDGAKQSKCALDARSPYPAAARCSRLFCRTDRCSCRRRRTDNRAGTDELSASRPRSLSAPTNSRHHSVPAAPCSILSEAAR